MDSNSHLDGLFDFIWGSPSPYHAVRQTTNVLAEAAHGKSITVLANAGTVIAALAADKVDPGKLAFRIVGAHTDSPNLRIKPQPDTGRPTAGGVRYRQLAVEPYGGVLLNSWLDRDLGLSGRVVVRTAGGAGGAGAGSGGATSTHLLEINRPLLRVPQLAIHLDRDVTKDGLKLASAHMVPIWGQEIPGAGGAGGSGAGGTGAAASEGGLKAFLAAELDVESEHILAWDLMTHDLTPPATLGVQDEFYAAARIDNLTSCHSAAVALAQLSPPELGDNSVAVIVLYDHEEVGSASATGAAGPALQQFLERVAISLGADRDQFLAALTRSVCVSADGAHGVHPNYVERHDSNHHVHLNGGPVIKLNANQRYATDANTSAIFQAACQAAGVPFQQYSHHSDLPCGSTIGPLTATQLGVPVVDVGCAQLSMHSARELGGSQDPAMLTAALREFLKS